MEMDVLCILCSSSVSFLIWQYDDTPIQFVSKEVTGYTHTHTKKLKLLWTRYFVYRIFLKLHLPFSINTLAQRFIIINIFFFRLTSLVNRLKGKAALVNPSPKGL